MAEKVSQSYVDRKVETVASGTPKGAYTNLSNLQSAYPTGATGTYVVQSDGKIYGWINGTWTAITQYQSPIGEVGDISNFANLRLVNSTLSANGNTLVATANSTAVAPYASTNQINTITGHKYYFKAKTRVINANATRLRIQTSDGGFVPVLNQANPVENQWYEISAIGTKTNTTNTFLRIYADYPTIEVANGQSHEVQYVTFVDLTETFGAGNEPTKVIMDKIINIFPNAWFEGTVRPEYKNTVLTTLNDIKTLQEKQITDLSANKVTLQDPENYFTVKNTEAALTQVAKDVKTLKENPPGVDSGVLEQVNKQTNKIKNMSATTSQRFY